MSTPMKIDLPYAHTDRDKRSGIVRVSFLRRLGDPKIRLPSKAGTSSILRAMRSASKARYARRLPLVDDQVSRFKNSKASTDHAARAPKHP
jgi:hypothetical protein